ncbi:PepSY-associated TM helix domain-containing protein [Marinobacterium sp. BA1]|uniref:PepSY-associated TM helix domain-containing protein n=1 Tax=Marinobacterium sp. BA1 TaxID=3138931 RepID=UPI0034E8AA5A
MKERFRQSMAWLHTWSGLVVGWVLFFVFVTGTAGYFNSEITRWMQPELPLHQPRLQDNGKLVMAAMDRLQEVAPTAEFWSITLPHRSQAFRRWEDFSISWETMPREGHEHGVFGSEVLDPGNGEGVNAIDARDTGGGGALYVMHYALHYMDAELAFKLVGVCTMIMLVSLVSGIITHKKIFKDFFTFRPGKGQRSWLDAHNVMGVMALPFFLMITYSGLVFFGITYMPAGIAAIYGTDDKSTERYFDDLFGDHSHKAITRPTASVPDMIAKAEAAWGQDQVRSVFIQHDAGEEPQVDIGRVRGGQVRVFDAEIMRFHAHTGEPLSLDPPDGLTLRTDETLRALHEGRFAGPWLRWLYFIAGLLGCGMIGTGLVLWTVKRRKNHEATGGHCDLHPFWGLRLVEALNVATIAGLPAGVAAYFWANRLLPVEMADRANWEMHFLFLIWGEALIYAFFRCSDLKGCRKAWVELLWLAAAAFALLPLINALTTDKHLLNTVAAGDWVLAGFDLTMLALGLAFGYMAIKVKRIWLKKAAQEAQTNNAALAGEAA